MFRLVVILILGWFLYQVVKRTSNAARRKGFREEESEDLKGTEKKQKYNKGDIEDADFKDLK